MSCPDLISRLDALTGPDPKIDAEICPYPVKRNEHPDILKDGDWLYELPQHHGRAWDYVPRYTASIDAALTLVPNGWHPVIDYRDKLDGSSSVVLYEFPQPCRRIPEAPFSIIKTSAAIALLIAILIAREAIIES
jgi:hypothetical protein